MSKNLSCAVIIKDDFKNVLIIQKKGKKNAPKYWQVLERDVKGRETHEKCIDKVVKEDLKSIIFNLSPLNEYQNDSEDEHVTSVYCGDLKNRIVLGDKVCDCKWINESKLEEYEFIPLHKEMLIEYFKSL